MKDLQEIGRKIRRLETTGAPYVLATVVHVCGSAYRGPGAHLLITSEGEVIGTLSGGCVEGDVVENARRGRETGEPMLLTYDSTADDDILWGTGLGCRGVTDLLLERFPATGSPDYARLLGAPGPAREPAVVATLFRVDGRLPPPPIQRLVLHPNGACQDNVRDPAVRDRMRSDAGEELARLRAGAVPAPARARAVDHRAARAQVLLEGLQPPLALVIFGAGPDAVPLVRLGCELGWQVTVADHRPDFAQPERLPGAHAVLDARPADALEQVCLDRRTAVVVMTHNYLQDLEVVRQLAGAPVEYVGLLGTRDRTDRLLAQLREEGAEPPAGWMGQFFSPAGLDLGGESAEEIALSIAAEIQTVMRARPGTHLGDRDGPIHPR